MRALLAAKYQMVQRYGKLRINKTGQVRPVFSRCMQALMLIVGLCCMATLHAQEKKMTSQQEQQILQYPERISSLVNSNRISAEQIPDPHWREDACIACHKKEPSKQKLFLRDRNIDRLCNNCHSIVSNHSYIHPSGMDASIKSMKRMSKEFKSSVIRSKGKLSCVTCHDMPKQCLSKNFSQKHQNPLFFRAGPFRERTEICFKCHDEKSYERLNPHSQVDEYGEIRESRCRVCHHSLEGLTDAKNIEKVDFNLKANLSKMCTGCHPWKPHPGGSFQFAKKGPPNHLVKLPTAMKEYYDRQQAKSDVLLPLEPGTGKVFCGTCHNPHEEGVVKNASASKGAGSKQRLRMVDICVQCHDK